MPKSNTHSSRESWLAAAVTALRPLFDAAPARPAKTIHALTSWPYRHPRALGQCFLNGEGSEYQWTSDGSIYVIVAPTIIDPVEVLDVLVHEMVHACGIPGHGAAFKKVATAVGLEGRMTSSYAGEALRARLVEIAADLGPYPHVAMMAASKKPKPTRKTQVKLASPADPDYTIWIATKLFEEMGPPLCPWSSEPMVVVDRN